MTMTLESFTVDSNGRCLICLVKPKSDGRNAFPSGSHSVSSLQAISHYLNLDLGKLFRDHIKGITLKLLPNFGLKATLCEECVSIHQDLLKLYLQLVQIEIEMGSWLKLIRWKLSEGDDAGRAKCFKRRLDEEKDLEAVEKLRREALQKCCLKLSSVQPTSSDEAITEEDEQGTSAARTSTRKPIQSSSIPGWNGFMVVPQPTSFDQCLICLVNLNREWLDLDSSTPSRSMRSLKALTQYLKITLDLTKIPTELKLSVCPECDSIHQEFLKLHQQLVNIEMEMGTWLKLLHGKLFDVDKAYQAEFMSSGLGDGRDGLKLVKDLRTETLEKCSLKLDSILVVAAVTDKNLMRAEAIEHDMDAQTNSISDGKSSQKSINFPTITKGKNLLQCLVCGKEFYHQSSLAAHRLTHVLEVKPDPKDKPVKITPIKTEMNHPVILSCRRCKFGFTSLRNFEIHNKKVHLPPTFTLDAASGSMECDLCHSVFSSKEVIQEHFNLHQSQIRKCAECGGVFESETRLHTHHQRTHLEILEFQCPDCKEIMPTSKSYSKHMRICPVGDIISCRICKKGFRVEVSFRSHFKQFHENTRTREVFKCDICHQKCKSAQKLANHRRGMHKI